MSFIFGSFACGFLVSKNEVHFGKSMYGLVLMANSFLLVATVIVADLADVDCAWELATYIAATACGLQNGMCTMHFGAVVRTTHVTGLATDFGVSLGRVAAIFTRAGCLVKNLDDLGKEEVEVDKRRLQVYAMIFTGFIAGSFFGTQLHFHLGLHAMLVPASITGTAGLLYTFFRPHLKQWFRSVEVDKLNHDVEEVDQILERTRSMLAGLHSEPDTSSRVEDLDAQIGHALSVLHDVEASITVLYETRSSSNSNASPSSGKLARWESGCSPVGPRGQSGSSTAV